MNQTSIFDIAPQEEIVDLPIAISKPKAIDFEGFKIGDRVGGVNKFKNLQGNITGFEIYCDIPFVNIDLDFRGSAIKYSCPISNLRLSRDGLTDSDRHSTDSDRHSTDSSPSLTDKLNNFSDKSFQTGDRVAVLEHQFVCGKEGKITGIDGKLCAVDFGSGENIWAIAPCRLKKV